MNKEMIRDYLLEHSRSSLNGSFPHESHYSARITNPICGDHVELRIKTNGEHIQEAGYKAVACAICSASASLLTEVIKGRKKEEAIHYGALLEKTIMENKHNSWPQEIQSLICFEHLRENPSRRMCALLPWVVLRSAFKNAGEKA